MAHGYTAPPHPSVKEIKNLKRQVEELRRERGGLHEIIAELKAPLQELHSKQAEANNDLKDPAELEDHRLRAWEETDKVGLDYATMQVRETPPDVWPEGVDPEAYVRGYYGLTPDGARVLYEDGGRSEAARPLEQTVAPATGGDVANTYIGKLASGQPS